MISNVMDDVAIDEKITQKIDEPNLYKVIFLNDNATPMEFVIEVLMTIFKHSETTARDITVKIHEEGSAVVGLYTFEIAEQKGVEATNLSRSHGFPLQIKVEKE
jgi:ATP-dependent Clp protease adaptor protein ClpS|tara:strand:+ start:26110 stop:26421 length:312 start_codon:yes stop_codon:yes gene_type:complete